MEAGRELDALIAEKVMGWSSQADGLYWDAGNHRTRLVLGSIIAKKRDEMGLENAHGFVFAPSTNIADAWEVVEKLGRWRGFDFMLVMPNPEQTFHLHTYEAGWYEATNDGPERRVVSDADTAPLAICLAALKAVSQEGQG
jgi:hypothetical protein